MANRITDERLREMADGWLCSMAECLAAFAELLAARAEVERLREQLAHPPMQMVDIAALPNLQGILDDLKSLKDCRKTNYDNENRAWEALGKPEGTHDTTNVQRLCAEVERLRGELREAVELLYTMRNVKLSLDDFGRINERTDALLARHKETP